MLRRIVVAGAAMVFVAGCGGGSNAGLTDGQTEHVRVAYPKDWQRQNGAKFTVRKTDGGKTVAQLTVLERVVKASTADLAVETMQAARWNLQNFRRGEAKDAEVKGARDARRLDYTYTSTEGGVAQPAAGTDLVALVDRDVYVVRITWLKDKLPEKELAAMVKSVELKEE
jgi:hypothetical protein